MSEDNSRVYDVGYENGYDDGIRDTQIEGVANVVNFNQLQTQPININQFYANEVHDFSYNNGVFSFISYANGGSVNTYPLRINCAINHKYYIRLYIKTNTSLISVLFGDSNVTNTRNTNNNFDMFDGIITSAGNIQKYIQIIDRRTSNWTTTEFKNEIIVIDLTNVYGLGNEPTIDDVRVDFPSNYYPYTTSELVNIDYERGYFIGEKDGYQTGYEKGKDEQATQQLTSTGWIQNIFSGFQSFFNLQILPGVSIGLIVGIPFIISLAYFVIRAFRGGGGA